MRAPNLLCIWVYADDLGRNAGGADRAAALRRLFFLETRDHRRIPKYREDWVPAFMNHQIRIVEKKEACAARCGIHQKQEIEAQPANSRISRNWLPFAEMFFQEIHSDKRSKWVRSPLSHSVGACRNSSTAKSNRYFRIAASAS